MFDILSTTLVNQKKAAAVAGTEYLIQNFTLDVVAFLKWKHTDVTSVAADHFLVSLLIALGQKIGYDPNFTINDLYRRAHYQIPEMCNQFGLTYSTNPGRLHVGDSGNTTLYLLGESPLRAGVTPQTRYQDIVALRYLSHDSTNVTMGSEADAEDQIGLGFDIIEIDLGLLMLQNYLWMHEQMNNGSDNKRNLLTFVSMYVMPSLKVSQYPLAFMNRMVAIAQGLPVDDTHHRITKAFVDRTQLASETLTKLSEAILKREVTFDYLLEAVPVPLWESVGAAHTMPSMAPTRQVIWALVCARYNLVNYLFTFARMEPDRARRFPVDNVRRVLQRMDSDDTLRSALKAKDSKRVALKFEQLCAKAFR